MRATKEADGRHRVVVIGGGMAGARLTQQLATVEEAELTVIGEEPHAPYNRVLLAEVLAGRYAPEVIALPAPAAHHLSGVRAVRIDRDTRIVHCDDGRRVTYDTLVLATGSNPVLPPLRGLFEPDSRELPDGVHAFRTMDDCLALDTVLRVRPEARAVVIGGGLLGVSAARALAQRGAQVVLAHQGEHLMERQLDAQAARLLHRHMAALGVEVHTECRVRGLRSERPEPARGRGARAGHPGSGHQPPAAGRGSEARAVVRAVELADGYALDADLVVLACGVRPRVGLAKAAGLAIARGIVVDDTLRTNDPRIHAIGDCAEHDGVLYGLAGPAQEQADLLAQVIAAQLREPAPGADAGRAGAAPARVPAAAHAPGTSTSTSTSTGTGTGTSSGTGTDTGTGGAARIGYTGTRALTRLTLASLGTATPDAAPVDGPGTAAAVPFDLAAFGEPVPAPGDDVVHLADATRNSYRKVVVRGDRLVGGILLGDLGTVGALARTWEGDEPLPSAPLLHLLTDDGGS